MVITDLILRIKLLLLSKNRRVYLVLDGSYKGEWLIQVSKTFGHSVFFSLPDKFERIIPDKDIQWALQNKVIVPVDVLPKKVYNVCVAEYEHAKRNNTSDRRQQRATSRSLDRQKYKDTLSELQGDRNRELVHLFKDDKE